MWIEKWIVWRRPTMIFIKPSRSPRVWWLGYRCNSGTSPGSGSGQSVSVTTSQSQAPTPPSVTNQLWWILLVSGVSNIQFMSRYLNSVCMCKVQWLWKRVTSSTSRGDFIWTFYSISDPFLVPILDFTLRDLIGTNDWAIVNSHVFLTECTFSDIQKALLVSPPKIQTLRE